MTRKHALFSFVAVFLLGAGVSQAGLNAWSLSGPGGGPVGAVAIHPTDATVVLASAGNGMYRSVDGGLTWTRTGDAGDGTDIFFDPANPNRVFVVAEGIRMYRSDDAGLSFSTMAGPPNATPHRLGISGDGTMYMVDRRGHIYRSGDHGLSWPEVGNSWPLTDEAVSAIAVDRVQANVLYAAVTNVGTFKSINSGTNWTGPIANSPGTNNTLIFQIVIKPDDPNRILGATNNGYYVSSDAGVTWSQPAGDIPLAFAFKPGANNNVIGVSWFGQIVRSSDGGLHWYMVDRGADLQVSPAQRLAYGPANKVIVATADGPMVSTDDGTTFTLRVSGMHAESVRSLSMTDGGVIFGTFVPGPFGIYRRDGGSWEAVGTTQLRNRFAPYPAIQSVTVAPGNPNRLFAVGFTNQLVSSFDGGLNWSSPHPAFTNGNPVLMRTVVDPTDQQIVYVLTQNTGVWKSENGGSTFDPRTTGLPNAVSALVVDRTNNQILYAGAFQPGGTASVFKSVNGGVTWSPTGTLPDQGVTDLVLDPVNSSVVYAVLSFSLHKSTNGGATWNEVRFTPAEPIAARGVYFDSLVPTTMFIGAIPAGAGFSRSVDSGATWQQVSWTGSVFPSLGGPDVMILDRVFSGTLFAGGYGTGLYQYQIANDMRLNFNAPLSFALGSSGSLTIPVQNAGPFDAASPELQFNIPSNITVTVPAGCRFVAPSMVCRLPNISSGATYNFMLPYSASETAANLAMGVYLFGREVELTPNDTQVGIAVNVLAMADLGLTTTGTASAQQNQPVTYTATVTNSGPNPSAVTTLTVLTPAGITIQTRTPTVGTCTANGTSTICELGVLASGTSASVSIVGTALTVGTQAWSGTVTTGAQDSVAANDTASLTTTVTAPPPPVGGGSSSGGGGGGGGRFDWLAVLLLGGLAVSRARLRVSARR